MVLSQIQPIRPFNHYQGKQRNYWAKTSELSIYTGLQINIWLDRTFVRSLLILVGHNLNLVGQKPTSLNWSDIYTSQDIYKSRDKFVYSHSDATKKMYVTIFFVIGPMSDQNYFCSDICQI
jgi:hypothetical protein